MAELRDETSKVNLTELVITDEDLYDEHCDPAKPVKVQFSDISAAAYRIRGGLETIPCTRSHMSDITGMEIFFKKEFLQYTGSFKERGARYTMMSMSQVAVFFNGKLIIL